MPVNLIVGNDGGNNLDGSAGADLIYGYNPNGPQSEASGILATRVATGLGSRFSRARRPAIPAACSSSRRPD